MEIRAQFHGAPGRLPFVGHFRFHRRQDELAIAVAGVVAGREDISAAFRAARELEMVLSGLSIREASDRHDLLNLAWARICDVDACDLGPQGGADRP